MMMKVSTKIERMILKTIVMKEMKTEPPAITQMKPRISDERVVTLL